MNTVKREVLITYRGDRSQQEMAAMYGVTQQAWSSWENGITKPDVVTMQKLSKDIGKNIENIFFDVFNK